MIDPWLPPAPENWQASVRAALAEDVGPGDISARLFDRSRVSRWYIEAQQDGVVCGIGIAHSILSGQLSGWGFPCEVLVTDGRTISSGTRLISGQAPTGHLLTGERSALNFLAFLSGVATLTAKYVKACEGTNARIVDTRKTLPNLRALQKYAVRCGGGYNHRFGLFDGIMIKDNHLAASGSIAEAIETARKLNHHLVKVEVECETEAQVAEALRAGADVILLDNMEPERMARILQEHRGEAVFEASGGVSLETVAEIARTGVDAISVGAITHSAPALAMHLELE